MKGVWTGAILHDIGKVYVTAEILQESEGIEILAT
jgi:HD-GYP domain-containing protein (c-di-GMP phosphodiesterase class II)